MKTALLFFLMCLTASAQTFIDKYGPYSKFQGDGSGVTGVTAVAVSSTVTNQWKRDATNAAAASASSATNNAGATVNLNAATASAVASGVSNQWRVDATNAAVAVTNTLRAEALLGTMADARHSANVTLTSTNATAPTLTPNTNAAGGMNFGATAVIQPGWSDVSITNNLGQVFWRQVSFTVAYNTGAGTQPSSCNLGTNTVSPAFAFMPAVTVTEVCTNGSGWLANGLQRQLIANNSTTSGCSVQQVGATLLAGTTYYVSVTMTGR